MSWATLDWPPKNGNGLKPKPKPKRQIEFLKPIILIFGLLCISFILLLAATWKYSDSTWPYPAKLVQEPLVKQCQKLQQSIYELLPDEIKSTKLDGGLPVHSVSRKPVGKNAEVLEDKTENAEPVEQEGMEPKKNKSKSPAENLDSTEKKNQIAQQVSRSGETLRYEQEMDMLATAYTHTGNPTASGEWPEPGMVAVDPNVIPLGTRVYVEGYGYATALDTGSAIKGNRVDLFMDTKKEALRWGVRKIKVYVLK
ncbi:MAG: hypothetical protein FH758_14710 [Firmicutes bacterium]|nr:hypothetical protein [Bacillota bacterium]